MKKAFPIALMIFGLVFIGAGFYTANRGFDAKDQVRDELIAQNITTTEDASIPNTRVDSPSTARAMADIIDVHAREATGDLTYSELGRFAAKNGDAAGTNDEKAALTGADGKPVPNPLRNTAFQASSLRTSLYTSIMAFNVADLVVGLGAMLVALGIAVGGIGIALAGLAIPAFGRRLHVDTVTAPST
jgi:hypothetical protein